jgi:hypothetical protein
LQRAAVVRLAVAAVLAALEVAAELATTVALVATTLAVVEQRVLVVEVLAVLTESAHQAQTLRATGVLAAVVATEAQAVTATAQAAIIGTRSVMAMQERHQRLVRLAAVAAVQRRVATPALPEALALNG